MKSRLIHFLLLLVGLFITYEIVNLSFWLMCQPDTVLFYLGTTILLSVMFIGGIGIGEFVYKTYMNWKNKSDKK